MDDETIQRLDTLDRQRLHGERARHLREGLREYYQVVRKELWSDTEAYAIKQPDDFQGIAARVQQVTALARLWSKMRDDMQGGEKAAKDIQDIVNEDEDSGRV